MIVNDNCMSVLQRMPNESVDMIVTDPPYRTITGGNSVGAGGLGEYGRPSGMLSKNDGKIFKHNDIKPDEYAGELFRVLSNPGHCWVMCNELNRRPMEDSFIATGFKTHFLGAWVKNTCTPNRWGMKNGELIFLFRKGVARTVYTPSMKQFMPYDNPRNKSHPTEKPVQLMVDLIRASSLEGQTVLDPFCGTGSTCVAAIETRRKFIGIEINPEYADVANCRAITAKLKGSLT